MKECVFERHALLKILLHSLKNSAACSGILLGNVNSIVQVTDAIPVAHSYVTLTPVLETALSQIENYLQQQGPPGLRIVGYYQCNERLGDGELGAGRRVADRIDVAFPDSVAAVLDSIALQDALKQQQEQQAGRQEPPMLLLFAKDGTRGWVRMQHNNGKPSFNCPTKGVVEELVQLAAQGRHRSLVDFEEHLEDITADWLNPGLLEGPA